MTEGPVNDEKLSRNELEAKLRDARSRITQLESELAETNEGMVALTVELENAKDRYQTLFERGTDAILLVDPERKSIHDVNPTACELFGYDRDEILSSSMSDLFPDESEQFGTLADAVVHGYGGDYLARTKQGRNFTVALSTSKVTLHGKLYLLASLRDVTRRKQRQQRLEVLTRVFRHNLRNDGNVIQGHAEILSEKVEQSHLESSALEIESKIERLLQLSRKIRRIQEVVERDRSYWVTLDQLLERQQMRFDERVEEGTLVLSPSERDVVVERDLEIAIHEAIDNAVTHGSGEPTIDIRAEVEEDVRRVTIIVEDDGPGIPKHELNAVRSKSETPLIHGSGIGLWSIHWVVDTLGGEFRIETTEGKGSTITMVVPYERHETRESKAGTES